MNIVEPETCEHILVSKIDEVIEVQFWSTFTWVFYFLLLYTSTQAHFRCKYSPFYSTTFIITY